jgi:hypothetical protein
MVLFIKLGLSRGRNCKIFGRIENGSADSAIVDGEQAVGAGVSA